MTADPMLAPLNRLVGTWTTEATHPAMPGVVVHGTVVVEWLEGERFLRFTGRFADGGDTIVGASQLREDDVHWTDDLAITYRRQTPRHS
jgi:hypothetical protein